MKLPTARRRVIWIW